MSVDECQVLVGALAPLLRELGSAYGISDGFQPLE
jgi:hypothetical protein